MITVSDGNLNKINGHDIKDENMFTLVIFKRHSVRFLWFTSHHVFWRW